MPFTPFHLGPGAVFKAIGGRHFSFMVFGGAQVLIDIEPGLGLVYGWPVLHGWTHTIGGALAIGALAGVIGRPISEFVLRLLRIPHPPFTWTASFAGAFAGTFSHIALDALMHGDIRPWRPFSGANPWYGLLPMDAVYDACLVAGAIGAALVAARGLWPRREPEAGR
jgi:hypothetical protein